jgi:hypothetical protein
MIAKTPPPVPTRPTLIRGAKGKVTPTPAPPLPSPPPPASIQFYVKQAGYQGVAEYGAIIVTPALPPGEVSRLHKLDFCSAPTMPAVEKLIDRVRTAPAVTKIYVINLFPTRGQVSSIPSHVARTLVDGLSARGVFSVYTDTLVATPIHESPRQ